MGLKKNYLFAFFFLQITHASQFLDRLPVLQDVWIIGELNKLVSDLVPFCIIYKHVFSE